MKKIQLTQGKMALVDDEDYVFLSQWKWHVHANKNKNYAIHTTYDTSTKKKGKMIMHRIIVDVAHGFEVDHIDGNGLNNQKINLRICTHSENTKNQGKHKNNTSVYKGVYYNKDKQKYQVNMMIGGIYKYVGRFTSKEEAYRAYCLKASEVHKDFIHKDSVPR